MENIPKIKMLLQSIYLIYLYTLILLLSCDAEGFSKLYKNVSKKVVNSSVILV